MPAVSFIDAIPNNVSVEEHRTLTGVTPTSFGDIPPVLRQKVENVRLTFDPSLDGFSPEDGVLGTLYIIERFPIPFFLFSSKFNVTLMMLLLALNLAYSYTNPLRDALCRSSTLL